MRRRATIVAVAIIVGLIGLGGAGAMLKIRKDRTSGAIDAALSGTCPVDVPPELLGDMSEAQSSRLQELTTKCQEQAEKEKSRAAAQAARLAEEEAAKKRKLAMEETKTRYQQFAHRFMARFNRQCKASTGHKYAASAAP